MKVTETTWKPFIELTLAGNVKPNKGTLVFDCNSKVQMIRDDEDSVTYLLVGDNSICVSETPEQIVDLVEAKKEAQAARLKAEHDKLMDEFKATQEAAAEGNK